MGVKMIVSVRSLTASGPPAGDDRGADLTVYLRQHHAERDLAELGALVSDRGTTW